MISRFARRLPWALCLAVSVAAAGKTVDAQEQPYKPTVGQPGKDTVWVPTPDVLVEKIMLWIVTASTFMLVTFLEWMTWLRQKPVHPGFITVLAIVFTAFAAYKVWRARAQAVQLRLGLQGELAVGEALEVLRAHGYRVFHDLPGDGFNVDHVVVGPGGVFVIETKAISKPTHRDATITYDGKHVLIDGHTPDRDPIKQARACRDFVIGILEKSGIHNPRARAAVVYPGWYIEKQPRGVEVWVLTPKALHSFVLNERPMLTAGEVALIASALDLYARSAG